MLKSWHSILRLLPLTALALLLTGCGKTGVSALEPLGKVAETQLNLMIISLVIMVVVVLVVGFLFTYALIRFRKKPGDENIIPEQVEGNMKLEIAWTVIPLILLAILAVPTFVQTFALADTEITEANKDEVLKVKVTANQYWWQFEYPKKGVVTGQDLYVPEDTKVVFDLTSNDVIHSFWIPAFGGKQDMNPGLTTEMFLTFNETGTFKGRCAELCGQSHALMYFNVHVLPKDEFKTWVKGMKEGPDAPTSAVAQKGQKIFKKNCLSCHAVNKNIAKFGPSLANFADRENLGGVAKQSKENIVKWIKNPDNIKPGTNMPAFKENLTEDQIKAIAEYLQTLSVMEK